MKQDKKKHLYICDNCDHEFYLHNLISDRLVECSRCGKKTAYCDIDYLDDDVYIDDSDFKDIDLFTDSEFDDHFNYSEWQTHFIQTFIITESRGLIAGGKGLPRYNLLYRPARNVLPALSFFG